MSGFIYDLTLGKFLNNAGGTRRVYGLGEELEEYREMKREARKQNETDTSKHTSQKEPIPLELRCLTSPKFNYDEFRRQNPYLFDDIGVDFSEFDD